MKHQQLKLGLRQDEAAEAVGSPQLLAELEHAGWLKPVIHRHRMKIFDKGDLLRAWGRIQAGELPPRIRRVRSTGSPKPGQKCDRSNVSA
jgi:hypothetical protein